MSQPQQLTIKQAISRAKRAIKQGNVAIALQFYNAVLQHQPNHPIAKRGVRKLQKEFPQYRSVQERNPNPSQDKINALVSLFHSGQLIKAEQTCKKLLRVYPKSVVAINVLGAVLQESGKLEEAVQAFDKAIQLRPDYAQAYSNRGVALTELGKLKEAVVSCDKAIQLNPDYSVAYSNRGGLHEIYGQLKEAVENYEMAIQLKPGNAEAHHHLSSLKNYEQDDPQIELMETLFTSSEPTEKDRIHLCFALAKAYGGLGEYNKSFSYYEEGNSLRNKQLSYDIGKDKRVISKIREIFSAEIPALDVTPDGDTSKRTLFIVGMPRSGTSLVEQILASHTQVYGAGELDTMRKLVLPILSNLPDNNFHQQKSEIFLSEINTVRKDYLGALAALNVPEKIITDKMPLNFLYIGFMLTAFPEAKIIHISRDPRATCWSIYNHYFSGRGNGYAYDMGNLAEFYNLYIEMMSFWRKRFPDNIYDLSYENLTENQHDETRRLLEFCDLEWEENCLDFHNTKRTVITASSAQVRKKMYKGSSEAWRKYEGHLKTLLNDLVY